MKKIKITIYILFIFLICGGVAIYSIQKPSVKILTDSQINDYSKYKLTISENTTRADIKKLCEKIEENQINEIKLTKYKSNDLEQFLYDYHKMAAIEEIDEYIYIEYITKSDLTVYLGYSDTGFHSLDIYNMKKDALVSINGNDGKKYYHFSN